VLKNNRIAKAVFTSKERKKRKTTM